MENCHVAMKQGKMTVLLGGVEVKPSSKRVHISSMLRLDMPDETQFHVGVGSTRIHVSRDLQPGHFFLNMQAKSLRKLGCRIGGLLGEDDHAHVSKPPAECKQQLEHLLLQKPPNASAPRPFCASASMMP